jgi:uncharacterized protein GlcG (DUF336 family)
MAESPAPSAVSSTVSSSRISSAGARSLIEGAVAHARQVGKAFSIAVVDDSGVLKAFERMDGAPLITIQVAQDKAYTAAGFGLSTAGWYDFIKDDAPLALGAPTGIDRLVVFGGGIPVVVAGAVVGAIGVSGGHYSEDAAVAQAGVDHLGSSGG